MKKKFVIDTNNFKGNLMYVVWSGFFAFTCLHYWNAPLWLIGAIMTLFVLRFLKVMVADYYSTEVDLFSEPQTKQDGEEKMNPENGKSKFQERLQKLAKERGIKID